MSQKLPLPKKVDWVSGAAFMLTQATLEKIGLMDQGYFLYFEEVDYMREARAAGFDYLACPGSKNDPFRRRRDRTWISQC